MNVSFKTKVLSQIQHLKHPVRAKRSLTIVIRKDNSQKVGSLKLLTSRQMADDSVITLLARWRSRNAWWFPAQFRVTKAGTRRWIRDQVVEAPDRMLFLIHLPTGTFAGHVGLYRFDYAHKMCEIDNIVRGRKSVPGLMYFAVRTMMHWAEEYLGIAGFSLRVFSDNDKAIRLYTRLGFRVVRTIPLCRTVDNGVTRWEERKDNSGKAMRFYLAMKRKGTP